jgi:hypothetical protein
MAMPLGFGWFTAHTYLRICEISADKHNLPATFGEWEARAQAQFDSLRESGIAVEKVLIDPDALLNWTCDVPIDSKKRAEFAAMILMKKHEAGY